jgi:hypothetical protein
LLSLPSWVVARSTPLHCLKTMPAEKTKARLFEPMLLLATGSLPEGSDWGYELKLDGYRATGFKRNGKVHLRSRNNKEFAVSKLIYVARTRTDSRRHYARNCFGAFVDSRPQSVRSPICRKLEAVPGERA